MTKTWEASPLTRHPLRRALRRAKLASRREDGHVDLEAALVELLEEARPVAGRLEGAADEPVGVDPLAIEGEAGIDREALGLGPNFGHLGDATRSIGEAVLHQYQRESSSDGLASTIGRTVPARHVMGQAIDGVLRARSRDAC